MKQYIITAQYRSHNDPNWHEFSARIGMDEQIEPHYVYEANMAQILIDLISAMTGDKFMLVQQFGFVQVGYEA